MIPGIPGWWFLLGFFALVPNPTQVESGMEEEPESHFTWDDDSQSCGITFHTPDPCPGSGASRRELEELREFLGNTQATLRDLEAAAAAPEENGTRFQDIVVRALPAIHEANLEFRESLENVRRELEEHVELWDRSRLREKKEELWEGIRLVSHMLLLTDRLAQSIEASSQRIQEELSRGLRKTSRP